MSKKEYKDEKFEVMYNTDFRKIPLHSFFPVERNFLMGICTKLKKQGTDVVEFTFDELKELTHWSKKNDKLFVENLKNTNEKLMSLKNTVKMGSITIQFVLFPLFKIDEDRQTLKVRVLKEFSYLLNDFDKFTSFDIEIYSLLSSSYSKTLFEELMNFKPKGIRNFKMEDFRTFLNIPASYRMSNIDQKVLNPIKEDFKEHFIFFEIEKVKKGRTITNIIFKFEFKNIVYKKIEDKSNIEEAEIIKINPNNEEMDKEELRAFFIDKFTSNGVMLTKPIKECLFKTLKKIGLKNTQNYLIELWENIQNEPKAKNKIGLFVDYIKREERKVDIKEIEEKEKKEPETVNPIINKLFGNEEKTEEYWDKATPNNIYQPNIFENAKSISKIQENRNQQKEQKNEKEKIKITQEEYDKFLEEYMKKLGYTDKKIAEFFFNKVNNYEIVKNDITIVVDEIENKYNSYNKEFREFWKLDYLKDEFEKIKEHYDLDDYLEMKKEEMKYLKEQYKEFEEWKKEQIKKEEEEHRKVEKEILEMAMGRGYEDFEDKKILYTEKDIPLEKLLSKNGKELKGVARTMRVKKILKEMNKE